MNDKDFADGFDPDDLPIDEARAAELLHKTPATLATWRSKGKGPRFRKVGRHVEYTRKFIKEFREACVRTPEPAAVRRQRRALSKQS